MFDTRVELYEILFSHTRKIHQVCPVHSSASKNLIIDVPQLLGHYLYQIHPYLPLDNSSHPCMRQLHPILGPNNQVVADNFHLYSVAFQFLFYLHRHAPYIQSALSLSYYVYNSWIVVPFWAHYKWGSDAKILCSFACATESSGSLLSREMWVLARV